MTENIVFQKSVASVLRCFALIAFTVIFYSGCKHEKALQTDRVLQENIISEVTYNSEGSNQAIYVASRYWVFLDTYTPDYNHPMEQKIINFIALLTKIPEEISVSLIGKSLEKSENYPELNKSMLKIYEDCYYDPNSPVRNEQLYTPVLEYIIRSDKLDDAAKSRAGYNLNMIAKNRVGEEASDFTYRTKQGEDNLHNLDARHTLLVFYNPECGTCRQILERMNASARINEAKNKKDMKILAFYTDGDIDVWSKYADSIPGDWINGYDAYDKVLKEDMYDLRAIPSIYLLDSRKKVILKDTDIENLERWLAAN